MVVILFTLCTILVALFVAAGFRLASALRAPSSASEAKTGLDRSPDFYRPMERLLSETDFEYMASVPGVSRRAVGRARAERRRIFRLYLKSLASDFALITADIRAIMVLSQHSRSDLAATLVRARLTFAVTMLSVEGSLLVDACGIHGLSVSASRLTLGLARMQQELALLNPAPALALS